MVVRGKGGVFVRLVFFVSQAKVTEQFRGKERKKRKKELDKGWGVW